MLKKETDIRLRKDRIGSYLKKYMEEFVFQEFSDSYMEKAGVTDLMKGVQIPLRKEDVEGFEGGSGIKAFYIADNMAKIMGIDPHFRYTEHYVAFLLKMFDYKIFEGMLEKGRALAEKGEYDSACIYFRSTLCMNPTYLYGMYSYAKVCRAMYLESGDEAYIGRFKAEAMDYFELITEMHPKFAEAYYYLGYAYLNMGLYSKAQITWKEFINLTQDANDRQEICERLQQIKGPVEIEHGYNAVLAGRYQEGIAALEPYLESDFKTWWPLFYFVGVCYARTGRVNDAIGSFKRVLSFNGSHLESMEELVNLYAINQDVTNETKYRKKIELIRGNLSEE